MLQTFGMAHSEIDNAVVAAVVGRRQYVQRTVAAATGWFNAKEWVHESRGIQHQTL
ncbi:hypothetical protein [Sphingobium olei]|uniref:Uncharacterized protein n=1 Tax=Sphingobium olei TaxID=420955 RepID=A0ABW3NZ60_9SPHN